MVVRKTAGCSVLRKSGNGYRILESREMNDCLKSKRKGDPLGREDGLGFQASNDPRSQRQSLTGEPERLSGPLLRKTTEGRLHTVERQRARAGEGGIVMENQAALTLKAGQGERPVLLSAPPSDSPSTVLALIERMALDPRADVEKLERVMAMYERLKAKEAELAYNAAKGRILKKLAGIKIFKNQSVLYEIDKRKPQKGTHQEFKYAPLEEIDKHLRPLLVEEDMDLSYSDEPREGGDILIRGRLKHLPSGHYEDSFMPAPPDSTGGKSSVQAVGSTNSFLRRYVVCNIFNIVVLGDDDGGTGGTIDEAQTKTILDLLKTAKVGPKFLKYMKAQSVEEAGSLEAAIATIATRDYRKAISTLEEHMAKAEVSHANLL